MPKTLIVNNNFLPTGGELFFMNRDPQKYKRWIKSLRDQVSVDKIILTAGDNYQSVYDICYKNAYLYKIEANSFGSYFQKVSLLVNDDFLYLDGNSIPKNFRFSTIVNSSSTLLVWRTDSKKKGLSIEPGEDNKIMSFSKKKIFKWAGAGYFDKHFVRSVSMLDEKMTNNMNDRALFTYLKICGVPFEYLEHKDEYYSLEFIKDYRRYEREN